MTGLDLSQHGEEGYNLDLDAVAGGIIRRELHGVVLRGGGD